MNTRGQTLLELVLASTLAMFLMTASVGVIENMQRETNRFKTQVDNDTTWMTANIHLARMVRSSSYVEVPNAGTLVLRNFNDTEKGRYVNNAANNSIDYMVNDGAVLRERYRNVRANFSVVPDRQRENKDIEVKIDYTKPFANMLNLRCAVDTGTGASGLSWITAVVNKYSEYGSITSTDYASVIPIAETGDVSGGYLAIANTSSPYANTSSPYNRYNSGTICIYIIKLDKNGKKVWSKQYGNRKQWAGESANYGNQTVNTAGEPDGYIISGKAYHATWGKLPEVNPLLMKIDLGGNLVWAKRFLESRMRGEYSGSSVCQSFNSSRNPDGFVMVCGWTAPSTAPNNFFYFLKTDMKGQYLWSKIINLALFIDSNNVFPKDIKLTLDADGKPDGYIIAGNGRSFNWTNDNWGAAINTIWLLKTNLNGQVIWSRQFKDHSYEHIYEGNISWVQQVFDDSGRRDGYILGGRLEKGSAMVRTNTDGVSIWSKTYDTSYGVSSGSIIYDKYGKSSGYAMLTWGGIIQRIDFDGNIKWKKILPTTGYNKIIHSLLTKNGNFDGFILTGNIGLLAETKFGNAVIVKTDKNGGTPNKITTIINKYYDALLPLPYSDVNLSDITTIVEVGAPKK